MSHITLPATKVKAACESYIRQREQHQQNRKEAIIRSYIGKWRPFRFIRTYEQAKDYCKNLDTFSDYYMCELSGGYEWSITKQLLALANHGDPVTITHEHSFILDYI